MFIKSSYTVTFAQFPIIPYLYNIHANNLLYFSWVRLQIQSLQQGKLKAMENFCC
jgi:hypothetical protein